ncbi:hypothetical protein [Autumnicola edwardsiae]|jgi:hypothetical protein|uniref:Uncharacterized protein n=1 Tax=Autumnicola edwardsiae TaxID=3075594 RepID=A0ABU3CVT6_9FLAO|nr:hypothetical protein [Zunongwangia sp. F297]MDT0650477.1 hypothetical protein [Zunongwangia sp. F297]
MENSYTPTELINEVKNLISYSISNLNAEKSNFTIMHRAIIKKYFEAKNVEIDYEKQMVSMQIPVGRRKYTNITFECQDMERFLKACLKEDDKHTYFYKDLLSHYDLIVAA